MTWEEFLDSASGCTDMQTSATGRYPWLYFSSGQAEKLKSVVIYACLPWPRGTVVSPPRDWSTREAILADYAALNERGARFNDTTQALQGIQE